MTGLDEFKEMFGSITVLNVVELLLAILFCYLIYRKVSKYLIERYEAGKKKDEQLKTALDQVSKSIPLCRMWNENPIMHSCRRRSCRRKSTPCTRRRASRSSG